MKDRSKAGMQLSSSVLPASAEATAPKPVNKRGVVGGNQALGANSKGKRSSNMTEVEKAQVKVARLNKKEATRKAKETQHECLMANDYRVIVGFEEGMRILPVAASNWKLELNRIITKANEDINRALGTLIRSYTYLPRFLIQCSL